MSTTPTEILETMASAVETTLPAATEAAEAMANGDTEKVFAAQQKNLDAVEKKINEEFVRKTPRPTGGSSSETITKETFSKMSLAEQYKYSKEHPEEYKTLYGGN